MNKLSAVFGTATVATLVWATACGNATAPKTPVVPTAASASAVPAAVVDPLGDRPALQPGKQVEIQAPTVFKSPNGLTVWLVERHALPLVAVTVALPAGSSSDPPDRLGLAAITASMLDEGAGKLDAIALSNALNDLGASIAVDTRLDASFVSLTILKANFAKGFQLLSDVVARPRFAEKDWKRVAGLWIDGLQQRSDDPDEVARVVVGAALYGARTAYGHPANGYMDDAKRTRLRDVKAFHERNWRADQGVIVVVGDVTRPEVEAAVNDGFSSWKPKNGSAPDVIPAASLVPAAKRPRLVLVDRADAPQSVISVVRDGITASDSDAPGLDLVNTALGGSFTSRLNQNLREDKHWTYGAFSRFSRTRGQGSFIASAAVFAEVTGKALGEMLGELKKMTDTGLSPDELAKSKAQDLGDLIQIYETAGGTCQRLAALRMLGLDAQFDAAASKERQASTIAGAAALARAHVNAATATIVVVGPRDKVLPQLVDAGLGEPEIWGPDGVPAAPAKPPHAHD